MSTSNAELDAKVIEIEARQGEVMLRKVYDFLGRFIAYPSTTRMWRMRFGLCTPT